jgi:DNA-binding MarR family transcriptional regulator
MTRPECRVPSEALITVLVKLGRAADHQLQQIVGASDVNANQFLALIDVARAPGISRADLARELRITPQAVTGIVTYLQEQGLVTRRSTGPGRPSETRISADGIEVLRRHGVDLRHLHVGMAAGAPQGAACAFDAEARRLLGCIELVSRRPMCREVS